MQWASSTTSRPMRAASGGSSRSRKSGLFSRSGLTSRTSTEPVRSASSTASHSSVLAELMVWALMPARAAASTWLRINASSGETMSVGPAPCARSSPVATKYTADFPHPVRCTTRARRCSTTSASIAAHWSSRNATSSRPTSARRIFSASGRMRGTVQTGCQGEAVAPEPSHQERPGRHTWSGQDPVGVMLSDRPITARHAHPCRLVPAACATLVRASSTTRIADLTGPLSTCCNGSWTLLA